MKDEERFPVGWKVKLERGNLDEFTRLTSPYCIETIVTDSGEYRLKAILTQPFTKKITVVREGETVTLGTPIPGTIPQLYELEVMKDER